MTRSSMVILMVAYLAGAEPTVSISINPGPGYTHNARRPPQIAIWAEDTGGNFIQTIFVTKFSRDDFGKTKLQRPDALPVWRHKGMQPDEETDAMAMATFKADAESGATPKAAFKKEWMVPSHLKGKTVTIVVEVNNSFDYNETYRKNLPRTDPHCNGVNGQPSIVWRGTLKLSETDGRCSLSPVGHGNVRGESGRIEKGFDGISDTFSIVKRIHCVYVNH